ncbi:MAG: heat-inducible transcriptional repressor HrcA [Vicinamibacteria bacterium]|nr:heat-inducible transcriptional repressor HrcA [Vicinamibacteria bacterium]
MSHALDERRSEVLKTLIQLHVATGEPVGSESLSRVLSRRLSPATLRNIMADLERLGLLDHPHTSAGRIPTDEGYRTYVDSLMTQRPLAASEASAIDVALRGADGSPTQAFENVSQLLSRLTQNVGFVLLPDLERTRLHRIDFLPLSGPRALAVLVSRNGVVTNKVIDLGQEIPAHELTACANYLNAHFPGKPLSNIRAELLKRMHEEKSLYDTLLQRVIALGERVFTDGPADSGDVIVGGAAHMFDRVELKDLDRMKSLFKTFEEKNRLVRLLNGCLSGDGLQIVIGHENPEPAMHDLSLVAASSTVGGEDGWAVGVLGTTRMEYARAVALVDHVARAMRRLAEENER